MGILSRFFGGSDEREYEDGYKSGQDMHILASELDNREHAALQVELNHERGYHSEAYEEGVYDGMKGNEPAVERPWWKVW